MIANLAPITAVYGGRLRTGRVASQHVNAALVLVHLAPYTDIPNDGGSWTDMCLADEHVKWIRGTYTSNEPEAQALLVAAGLV